MIKDLGHTSLHLLLQALIRSVRESINQLSAPMTALGTVNIMASSRLLEQDLNYFMVLLKLFTNQT